MLFARLLVFGIALYAGIGCAAKELPFKIQPVAEFEEPWAMVFLPDGRLLVTERKGRLLLATTGGESASISGVPDVAYGGQGGLGDVTLHPGFATNATIYLSYAEAGDGDLRGAAVARATLDLDKRTLSGVDVIWRQEPKVSGHGHYGHRLVFDHHGHLFVTSGERQKFHPAQDMESNLGKIIRLQDDGGIPDDNPFRGDGTIEGQVWSLGHRNPLGLAFDAEGRLWNHEMGPEGGDELNLVLPGKNYGYPIVSNGDHYDGRPIPDHETRPEFEPPFAWWTPVISPAGFIVYDAELFPEWRGDGFIGGLSSESLVRVELAADSAREVERFDMDQRIREIEQGPDGALWILEDEEYGQGGRLLKLTPRR
jgi:glucose/arabinose dehydrogenase